MKDASGSSLTGPPGLTVDRIALVGFMGAGKTTVGQALAAKLSWNFLDLDDLIQSRAGQSIAEIFEHRGETGFRALEKTLLAEVAQSRQFRRTVLSLGGGAFIDNTNQRLLRENGILAVFLDAAADELFRRCAQPGVVRPLLSDRERFGAMYAQRRPEYLKAAICVETTGKAVVSVAEEIITRAGLDQNQE